MTKIKENKRTNIKVLCSNMAKKYGYCIIEIVSDKCDNDVNFSVFSDFSKLKKQIKKSFKEFDDVEDKDASYNDSGMAIFNMYIDQDDYAKIKLLICKLSEEEYNEIKSLYDKIKIF